MAYNFKKSSVIFSIKNVDMLTLGTTLIFNTGANSFVLNNICLVFESSSGSEALDTIATLGFTGPNYTDYASNITPPYPSYGAGYVINNVNGYGGLNVYPAPPNTDIFFNIATIDSTMTTFVCSVYVEGFFI